jgi:hypothetical protein
MIQQAWSQQIHPTIQTYPRRKGKEMRPRPPDRLSTSMYVHAFPIATSSHVTDSNIAGRRYVGSCDTPFPMACRLRFLKMGTCRRRGCRCGFFQMRKHDAISTRVICLCNLGRSKIPYPVRLHTRSEESVCLFVTHISETNVRCLSSPSPECDRNMMIRRGFNS